MTYKATCKIDKGDGFESYSIWLKDCPDEMEGHKRAKNYMLTTFPTWGLYDITLKIFN